MSEEGLNFFVKLNLANNRFGHTTNLIELNGSTFVHVIGGISLDEEKKKGIEPMDYSVYNLCK